MSLPGQEIRNYAREERAQARLNKAHDHLRALLAIDTWVGIVGSGCERCRHCWGLYPDHKANCPRQAAQEYLDGLT